MKLGMNKKLKRKEDVKTFTGIAVVFYGKSFTCRPLARLLFSNDEHKYKHESRKITFIVYTKN